VVLQLLKKTISSPERVEFHPEKTLNRHIALVTLRAMLFTGQVDMVWAGLLHDLFKTNGEMKNGYMFAPNHPTETYEFIWSNDDIKYEILQTRGNWEHVADICRWHMACKEKVSKKAKHVAGIERFVACDDMICRKQISSPVKDLFLPEHGLWRKQKVNFCGIAPIHREKGEVITVTVNRTPITYSFSQIPAFFVGEWEWVQKYLRKIV